MRKLKVLEFGPDLRSRSSPILVKEMARIAPFFELAGSSKCFPFSNVDALSSCYFLLLLCALRMAQRLDKHWERNAVAAAGCSSPKIDFSKIPIAWPSEIGRNTHQLAMFSSCSVSKMLARLLFHDYQWFSMILNDFNLCMSQKCVVFFIRNTCDQPQDFPKKCCTQNHDDRPAPGGSPQRSRSGHGLICLQWGFRYSLVKQ